MIKTHMNAWYRKIVESPLLGEVEFSVASHWIRLCPSGNGAETQVFVDEMPMPAADRNELRHWLARLDRYEKGRRWRALRTGVEDMPSRITAKLRELGFDEEYKGFQYLVYLLGRVCEEYLAEGVAPLDMQALYQETADRFGIRYRTVESILHFLIRRAAWWGVNRSERPSQKVLSYCTPDSYASRPFVQNLAADLLDQWAAEYVERMRSEEMQKANICGRRIREARERRQPPMTQKDLSDALKEAFGLELLPPVLAKIEKQQRRIRDYELFAIAEVLGVSLSWLLEDDGQRSLPPSEK